MVAASAVKGLEHQTDGGLHLGVGIKVNDTVGSIHQSYRRAHLELAAPGLVELSAPHARLENVQLGFAHRALEAEQQAIVEAGRIVDAILVEDQGRGQGAELDQAVPIGRVAGQPGDLQTHDNAGLAQSHLADEMLEAIARRGTGSGFAEIVVDHMDPLGRPAGGDGPVTQSILTLGALDVLRDLAQGRLPDIEISIAAQVLGGDLKISHVPQPLLSSK